MLLRNVFLVFLAARVIDSYVYSCEEVKYQLVNSAQITFNTTYACVVAQEGFTNFRELGKIAFESGKAVHPLDVIAESSYKCAEKKEGDPAWKVTAPADLKIDCTKEFTVFFTSEFSDVYTPFKQYKSLEWKDAEVTLVVPQTGMWIRKLSCTGRLGGSVTLRTGAGAGEAEEHYDLAKYSCSDMPDWIISFDSVLTISVDYTTNIDVEFASTLGTNYYIQAVSGNRIAVFTSGKSDDLQNLQGGIEHRASIEITKLKHALVTANLQLTFDPTNYGAIVLKESAQATDKKFFNGSHTEQFNTEYFEIGYVPRGLQPTAIGKSQDHMLIEITIGPNVAPPTTTSATPADEDGCYKMMKDSAPFYKAQSECENGEGIIAAIHADQKGQFLQKMMNEGGSSSDYFWIGYEKATGVWQWEDKSTDPYTNWDKNEPSSAAVAKCAYEDKASGKWGAGNCQVAFPYICQYALGSKNC